MQMAPTNYIGSPPPVMSNIEVIYIDPNLTPYLQPLDAGIIAAFKAAYRRKYASLLVSRYNADPTTAVEWKLNILEAINLAVEAWDEIQPAQSSIVGKRQVLYGVRRRNWKITPHTLI